MVLVVIHPKHPNLFNNWYPTRDKTFRSFLLIGAALIFLSIWLTRNEIFDKRRQKTPLQVLFRGTSWLWFWTQFHQREMKRELVLEACRKLENVAMHFFMSSDGPLFQELSFVLVLFCNLGSVIKAVICNKFVWFLFFTFIPLLKWHMKFLLRSNFIWHGPCLAVLVFTSIYVCWDGLKWKMNQFSPQPTSTQHIWIEVETSAAKQAVSIRGICAPCINTHKIKQWKHSSIYYLFLISSYLNSS